MQIFAAEKESVVLIGILIIPRIVVLFYRSPLNMVAQERNSNENDAHFLYRLTFFYTESEPEYQENFPEDS